MARERRQRAEAVLHLLGVVAVAAVLAVFGVKMYYDSLIEAQQARNTYLQNEIKLVDARSRKSTSWTASARTCCSASR